MPKPNLQKAMNLVVKNEVQSGVMEIQLLDSIYDTFDWDTWEYTALVSDLVNRVNAAKPTTIKLLIDSGGGDCGIGLAIYNFLRSYMGRTGAMLEVEILAICGSIATVIASAASAGKLFIPRNAFWVIHQAWGGGHGNSSDLRSAADVIDAYTQTIVDVYAQRTGKTAEDLNAMIANGDCWISGADAVAQGFCDAHPATEAQFQFAARVKGLPSEHYKNIPSALLIAPPADGPESGDDADSIITSFNTAFMNFKDRASAFINTLKGKKVSADTSNVAEAVANEMAEPLELMLTGLQDEVTEEIKILTEANAKVTDNFEKRLKIIEDAKAETEKTVTDLQKENELLKTDIANKLAGKSDPGETEKPAAGIGRWSTSEEKED